MSTWYPGCKVRLTVRLEDNSLGILPPELRPTQPGSGPESFGPGVPLGLPDGNFLTLEQDIVPTGCTIELNNYRKADTAKIEFDLARLPIEPRLVRAITVQVFGGVFTAEEYAAANGPQGAQGIMLPDLPTPLTGVASSYGGSTNELFRGFADKHTITINESEQTVVLECRDLTGELLDAEIPPNSLADLPGFLRLDEAIQLLLTGDALADAQQDQRLNEDLTKDVGRGLRKLQADRRLELAVAADAEANDQPEIATAARAAAAALQQQITALRAQVQAMPPASSRFGLPGFRGIKVVNEVRDVTDPTGQRIAVLPTIEKLRPKSWLDSRGVTRKGRKKSTGNKQKIAFWDFIADLVTSAGYICFLRIPRDQQLVATELVITNPRTYYEESTTAGDTVPLPQSQRVFTWGLNALEVSFTRNLKGTAVPSVGVRAYDPATGERYGVIYPPLPKNNRPSATGDGDRTEIKQFNLDQISGDSPEEIRESLRIAAASIYEQLSRGDLEVSIKTISLSAIPGNAERGIIGDLFALRPKDPIEVELPATDPTTGVVSSGLILDDTDTARRIEQARFAGLDEASAIKLGTAASLQYVQREFRTRDCTFVWTSAGWEVSIGAINYLDVRDSVQVTNTVAGIGG